MTAKIIATGSYVPSNPVSNNDMARIVDTSDEWIVTRTGIHNRYITTSEGTSELATQAAKNALEQSQVEVESIDYIIVATMSSDYALPNTACEVQKQLGALHAACFDISVACSGFVYALQIASALLDSMKKSRAIVIGAETLSRMIDWTDRSTCVLFGDGAGAVILERAEHGIIHSVLGSDGSKGEALICETRPICNPYIKKEFQQEYMKMDGQEVFKFAVKQVSDSIEQALAESGTKKEEIAGYYLHQANRRILESIAKRLKVDPKEFAMNLGQYSNTSAASIPILLDEENRKGNLKRGDKIVLSGFGGGLTWGTMVMEW